MTNVSWSKVRIASIITYDAKVLKIWRVVLYAVTSYVFRLFEIIHFPQNTKVRKIYTVWIKFYSSLLLKVIRKFLCRKEYYSLSISNWALRRSYQRLDLVSSIANSCVHLKFACVSQILRSEIYAHEILHRKLQYIIMFINKYYFENAHFIYTSMFF